MYLKHFYVFTVFFIIFTVLLIVRLSVYLFGGFFVWCRMHYCVCLEVKSVIVLHALPILCEVCKTSLTCAPSVLHPHQKTAQTSIKKQL